MRIFFSYASDDRVEAIEIALAVGKTTKLMLLESPRGERQLVSPGLG